jgi:hypothetical protein
MGSRGRNGAGMSSIENGEENDERKINGKIRRKKK